MSAQMTYVDTSRSAAAVAPVVLKDVVWATDMSAECDLALAHARLIAERFRAHLTLYHAVEVIDHRYPHWNFAHAQEVWREAERAALTVLQARAASLSVRNMVRVERVASAAVALTEFIRGRRPDLAVVASHGRRGIAHLLLGSTTGEILGGGHRPLLCVRPGGRLPYRRILVPTDFSLASRLALPMAALLARTFGAEVVGVHVAGRGPRGELPSEAALWKFLEADFSGVSVTAQVHEGPVWERIVHTAEVEEADLVVMATRGHDSFSDRVLGSNTERVIRHAPCPVLVA